MQELIIYFIAGLLTGLIIMFFVVKNLKKEQSALKRKYEKTSVGADDSELKVKTLENKSSTLGRFIPTSIWLKCSLVTPSLIASCNCVKPVSFLYLAIFLPNFLKFSSKLAI